MLGYRRERKTVKLARMGLAPRWIHFHSYHEASMASVATNELPARNDWPEPLQPQDLVVTLLGSYVHPSQRTVWSGGLVELLAEFGFSSGAARVALARLVRRDLISRVKQGRLVHYAITPRCERLLDEGDARIFSLGQQAERVDLWTVLWHAIPEQRRLERGRVARRLRFLGFGSLQDGMWASPRDREDEVVRVLRELEVERYATVMVGRSARDLDLRVLVERAWDLEALAARYSAFVEEFSAYRSLRAQRRLDDRESFLLRTRLVHIFRGFPFLDPELPDDLMPDRRARAATADVFHRIYDGPLAARSQRHFDVITQAWSVDGQAAPTVSTGTRTR